MNTEKIISLYRKAKKGDYSAKLELQNLYIREQNRSLPKSLYDWSGLMGHSSAFYTADKYKDSYNRELYEALCYTVDTYLHDEEEMAS